MYLETTCPVRSDKFCIYTEDVLTSIDVKVFPFMRRKWTNNNTDYVLDCLTKEMPLTDMSKG